MVLGDAVLGYAVLGIDAEGTIVLLNNQMRTLFGLMSRDLGRAFRDLEISYRPIELRSLIEQAYAEHRVVRVNGVERPVGTDEVQYLDLHIQPLWGADGMAATHRERIAVGIEALAVKALEGVTN